jgi:hypothetical protein
MVSKLAVISKFKFGLTVSIFFEAFVVSLLVVVDGRLVVVKGCGSSSRYGAGLGGLYGSGFASTL